jgi:anti-sigma B factor antagonist
MDLDVTVAEGDPVVVALSGELDIACAAELEKRINELVGGGHIRLIVDLTDLGFCDSTGIGTFVRGNTACRDQGGYLRLAGPNRNVARVLAVVGLLDTFPTYRCVDTARRADTAGLITP